MAEQKTKLIPIFCRKLYFWQAIPKKRQHIAITMELTRYVVD